MNKTIQRNIESIPSKPWKNWIKRQLAKALKRGVIPKPDEVDVLSGKKIAREIREVQFLQETEFPNLIRDTENFISETQKPCE